LYDRGVEGSECDWARVLAYEPPSRVVFSWNLNGGGWPLYLRRFAKLFEA
jgi:hypothetical protein